MTLEELIPLVAKTFATLKLPYFVFGGVAVSVWGRTRTTHDLDVVAKFDRTAVARNKLKRRLRELVRRRVLPKLGSVDVLIRAKRDAYEASFAQLASAVDAIVGNLTPKS